MKKTLLFLAMILCAVPQLHGSRVYHIGGERCEDPTPEESREKRTKKMDDLKRTGQVFTEVGKRLMGGGGENILQNVINKHIIFCKEMGLVYWQSNSPMDRDQIKIPRIWVYYFVNAKKIDKDDLYRIYIAAYEELERLVNAEEELKPYLLTERYTREDDRLILGFNCVDENYVEQEKPNISNLSKNENNQLRLSYNKYGVKNGISGCVLEREYEEVGDYNEIKKRLGL